MANKVKMLMYVTVQQDERLREMARETGLAISEIVRRAIDNYTPPLAYRAAAGSVDTGQLVPTRQMLQNAARVALAEGLIQRTDYEAQIDRLGPPANHWTNARVLADFAQAPAAEVSIDIARRRLAKDAELLTAPAL